jgi:hypothetical protein
VQDFPQGRGFGHRLELQPHRLLVLGSRAAERALLQVCFCGLRLRGAQLAEAKLL